MKKNVSRLIALMMSLCLLFSNVTHAECSHDWEFEYDPDSIYEIIDENYHIVVATDLYYICTECGERRHEIQDAVGASPVEHRYSSKGVCHSCGYEKEAHEHDWEVEDEENWYYEYVDEIYHEVVSVKVYYSCTGCGKRETEIVDVEGDLSRHKYDVENVCKYCYHEKIVEVTIEPTERPTPTPKPTEEPTPAPTVHVCTFKDSHRYQDFKYYNEEKHSYRHVITLKCTVCGQKGEKTNKLEYGKHVFEDGVCKKCNAVEILASEEDKEYATKRIAELEKLLDLVITAMENGEVLYDAAENEIKLLSSRIYNYKEVQSNTRKLSTIMESPQIDIELVAETQKRLIRSGFGKNVPDAQLIAYYQIINNLEVTGWVTKETYNSVIETVAIKTEASQYLGNVEKLSAEELVDLIGSEIQFIQKNKSEKKLVKWLMQK